MIMSRHGESALVLDETAVPAEVWDDAVRGSLAFRTLFSSDRTHTHTMTTGVADLRPNGWFGRHRHLTPEVYYLIEGSGVIVLDGVEHRVGGGSAVFIPGGVEHETRNTGAGLLRFFYVFAHDSFLDVDYDFLT